jgi:hypothetical protein
MSFTNIKTLLLESSGRHDLVESSGETFLYSLAKAATTYLDLHFGDAAGIIAESWYKKDVVAGTVLLEVPGARMISEVWIADVDGGATELTKSTYKNLRTMYPEKSTDVDQGTPAYYAVLVHKLAPSQHSLTSASHAAFTEDDEYNLWGDQMTQKAIVILPPPDDTYTVSVKGTFFSPAPSSTITTNFWIENHPLTFVHAIMRELEIFYRNFEGAKTWEAAIAQTLMGIDSDVAEQAASNPSVMEG